MAGGVGGHAPMGMGGPHLGMGPVVNEEFQVPDRMVGLSKYIVVPYVT